MRINQFLARSGVCSRRKADQLIAAGHVMVNGVKVTTLGIDVKPDDVVYVDQKRIRLQSTQRLFRYYKPRGIICSLHDEQERIDLSSIAKKLPPGMVPVGRLDRASEGLLLWTDYGPWIEQLTHPRYGHLKHYRVVVDGVLTANELDTFSNLRLLPDGQQLQYPMEILSVVNRRDKTVLELKLREGKNQQIRQAMAAIGHDVARLVRLSQSGVGIEGLKPGQFEEVTGKRYDAFLRALNSPANDVDSKASLESS